jgi:hypothetical protein
MKFTIQREAFLKPLQQVNGVVERRQTLPVLGNVLINVGKKQVKLTATDLEVELQAQTSATVSEPGDITLPARKLLDICRTLPDEAELDISVKNDRAIVKSGKSRFTLSTLPASEFPVIDKIKSAIDRANQLCNGTAGCALLPERVDAGTDSRFAEGGGNRWSSSGDVPDSCGYWQRCRAAGYRATKRCAGTAAATGKFRQPGATGNRFESYPHNH